MRGGKSRLLSRCGRGAATWWNKGHISLTSATSSAPGVCVLSKQFCTCDSVNLKDWFNASK